jgi:hypothetical protein
MSFVVAFKIDVTFLFIALISSIGVLEKKDTTPVFVVYNCCAFTLKIEITKTKVHKARFFIIGEY